MRRRARAWTAIAALGCLLAGGSPALSSDSAPGDGPQKHILLLYPESRLLPAIVVLDQAMRAALQARLPGPVYFYTEYLDLSLFDGDEPHRELRELLRRKYAHRAIDLIIPADSRALRVALRNRAELFAGAPIVFAAVDPSAAAALELDADVTGTWLALDWAGTLETALRLQPAARRVVVVNGSSPAVDRVWLAAARKQLAPLHGRLEVSYLTDRSLEGLWSNSRQL